MNRIYVNIELCKMDGESIKDQKAIAGGWKDDKTEEKSRL